MSEVMGKTGSLHQITINKKSGSEVRTTPPQSRADTPADLGDFQAMGQPRPVEIIFPGQKYLRFALKPAECGRVDDPVPVHLKRRAVFPLTGQGRRVPVRFHFQKFLIEGVIKLIFHGK